MPKPRCARCQPMGRFARRTRVMGAAVAWEEPTVLDEHAVRVFLAADYPRIVGAVALVAGSRAAAEDAVAEALARAWERSDRGERSTPSPRG